MTHWPSHSLSKESIFMKFSPAVFSLELVPSLNMLSLFFELSINFLHFSVNVFVSSPLMLKMIWSMGCVYDSCVQAFNSLFNLYCYEISRLWRLFSIDTSHSTAQWWNIFWRGLQTVKLLQPSADSFSVFRQNCTISMLLTSDRVKWRRVSLKWRRLKFCNESWYQHVNRRWYFHWVLRPCHM